MGATTLLGKGLPKPALKYWSAKLVAEYVVRNPDEVERLRGMGDGPAIAALKAIPWQARDEAAVRGTDVHRIAEQVIRGEVVDVPTHLAGYVAGYVDWLEAFDVRPVLTERKVASRQWQYCGAFDAIVTFGCGPWAGRTALIDLKTAKAIYGETGLQTAAYALADWYVGDDDTEVPLPYVDCTGAAHVTDAGTQFYPFANSRDEIVAAHKVFTHIAYVAKQVEWIEKLVGAPMELDDVEAGVA
jgi:hypothetical protein